MILMEKGNQVWDTTMAKQEETQKSIEKDLETSPADVAIAVAKLVPVLGPVTHLADILDAAGPIAELGSVFAATMEKRQNKWLIYLHHGLDELSEKIAGLTWQSLALDPQFVDVLLQASQSACRTHQEEKLEALRNAILNTAVHIDLSEEKQMMFLAYINDLQVSHLQALTFFSATRSWLQKHVPEKIRPDKGEAKGGILLEQCVPRLKGDRQMCNNTLNDLAMRNLIKPDVSNTVLNLRDGQLFDPNGGLLAHQKNRGLAEILTEHGSQFLAYITDPIKQVNSADPNM